MFIRLAASRQKLYHFKGLRIYTYLNLEVLLEFLPAAIPWQINFIQSENHHVRLQKASVEHDPEHYILMIFITNMDALDDDIPLYLTPNVSLDHRAILL
jgi:hypothetical protein